jgi:hypothetical protein
METEIDIVSLNSMLESKPCDKEALRACAVDALWERWLWRTDATADAVLLEPSKVLIKDVLRYEQAFVVDAYVNRLTLRGLRDTIVNLQLCWKVLVEKEDIANLYQVVDACFHRFGILALHPLPHHELDDIEQSEQFENRANLRRLNLSCIRQMTSFFFIAYRHLHLASHAVELPVDRGLIPVFEQHMISASMESFY